MHPPATQCQSLDSDAARAVPDPAVSDDAPTLGEVRRAIRKLRNRRAGSDGIQPELFKYAEEPVSASLHSLFAQVWKSGLVPAEWREGIIVSLYKGKGPRNNCSSYRPISLLSVPGKVFANVLLARLQPLLTARRRPQQSGFTPCRSTIDAILALRLLSGIIVSLYKGKGPRNNWIPTLLVPFQILPFLTTHHSVPSTHHSRQ